MSRIDVLKMQNVIPPPLITKKILRFFSDLSLRTNPAGLPSIHIYVPTLAT